MAFRLISALKGAVCVFALMASGAAQAEDGAPAMWRLSDENSQLTIFGTMHLLPENVEWRTDLYREAMRESETTMFETDATSAEAQAAIAAAVTKYGLNPAGVTLSETLGADRAKQLETVATGLGVPMAALEPYRPWLATLTLSVVAIQKAGFNPESGVEQVVLALANEEGDSIGYFETPTQQVEMLASLDTDEMLANFDATLAQFEEFDALMARMLTSWRTGDTAGLERDVIDLTRDTAPDAFEKIFVQRNADWVEQIETIMDGEGDYFIAVGVGHLVGEDSVIDMLQDKGYGVDRIQ